MTDLNLKQRKFIDEFVHLQDPKLAAKSAGYKEGWGGRLYAMPAIREAIDQRMLILNTEKAKQTIKKRELCKDLLDTELTSVIQLDIKERPTLGPTKLNAIEMGYRRIGMINGGEFVPDPESEQARGKVEEVPRIFIATETEILKHKIETTRQVTRTVESSPYDF